MTAIELLKHQSELAFEEMTTAIEGVTQGQSWCVLPNNGPDYLHTDANILGVTLHVATGKVMYGSIAFRNSECRWREIADELETFEPDWERSVAYLHGAHKYWMSTWDGITDLEQEVPHFRGALWPAWKVIRMIIHHDSYHAGQIAMLRYAVGESEQKPPSVAEDIRKYCADLPDW